MKNSIILILFFLCFSIDTFAQIKIVEAFPNLSFESPVDIQSAQDGRLFVVEQQGKIYSFENDSTTSQKNLFLDIEETVKSGGERGLLGLAFHPEFKNNGFFFVDYTTEDPNLKTRISRFKTKEDNPDEADPDSELIFLEVDQPYSNHNAGQIAFGPDGYLYISFGDGGSGGDPQGNGQNLSTFLGSLIRIDVDNSSGGKNYSIPQDNPFVNNSDGYLEEIYAYGLRNIWRFSFDAETGELWTGDVGQNKWEEIDIIESGKNYGWNIMEGFHCYNADDCDTSGLSLPVWEYGHNDDGGYSITGGFVYRGESVPSIKGKYVYADFVSGNLWALSKTGTEFNNEILLATNYNIPTFGVDENEELYFSSFTTGKIYKFFEDQPNAVEDGKSFNFELYQNYPNPFNPETKISFTLPEKTEVELSVYDSLGNKIESIYKGEAGPGLKEITWKPESIRGGLSSGVYIVSLESDKFSAAKKALLLK